MILTKAIRRLTFWALTLTLAAAAALLTLHVVRSLTAREALRRKVAPLAAEISRTPSQLRQSLFLFSEDLARATPYLNPTEIHLASHLQTLVACLLHYLESPSCVALKASDEREILTNSALHDIEFVYSSPELELWRKNRDDFITISRKVSNNSPDAYPSPREVQEAIYLKGWIKDHPDEPPRSTNFISSTFCAIVLQHRSTKTATELSRSLTRFRP